MDHYDIPTGRTSQGSPTIFDNSSISSYENLNSSQDSSPGQEYYCLPEPASKTFQMKKRQIPDYSSLTPIDFSFMRQSRGYSSMRNVSRTSKVSPTRSSLDDSSIRRTRKNSVESDDSTKQDMMMAKSEYESEFWTPPFLRRRSRLSYAEEAIPAEEGSFCSDEESPMSKLRQKIWSSLYNLSLEKYREKHWYCYSCRRPKDRCKCMCSVS